MPPCDCCSDGNDKADISTDLVFSTMESISSKVTETASLISKDSVDLMLTLLTLCKENGNCVFVAGAGRSGLMGRAFAMRLMHLGLKAYVIGETVTPAVRERDILIAISGSGSTKSIVSVAEKCKSVGAYVISLTSKEESVLGDLSSVNVVLPSKSNADKPENNESVAANAENVDDVCTCSQLLMGSSFEILTLIFSEAVVMHLTRLIGVSEDEMKARHANTE